MAEHLRKNSVGRRPISRHPLFPATVTLWFGALFGLSGLAIRPGLLEQAVLVMNIQALIPAAAPPLGMTARILVALALAAIGALAGAVLAWRLRPGQNNASPRKRTAASAAWFDDDGLSPLERAVSQGTAAEGNPLEETGGERFSVNNAMPARLRAAPFAEPSEQIMSVAELGFESFDAPQADEERGTSRDEQNADMPEDEAGKPGSALFQRFVDTPPKVGSDADQDCASAHAEEGTAAIGPTVEQDGAEEAESVIVQGAQAGNAETRTAAERIATADLSELSHVELLERLAMTMERRRQAEKVAPADPEPARVSQVTAFPTDEASAGRTDTDFALPSDSRVATIPAGLRPIDIDDRNDEALPGFVPPRRIGMPRNTSGPQGEGSDMTESEPFQVRAGIDDVHGQTGSEAVQDDDERALNEGYSSLLDLSRPLHAGPGDTVSGLPVQSDMPEGESKAGGSADRTDPDDAEKALRSALATLQRMSGTG